MWCYQEYKKVFCTKCSGISLIFIFYSIALSAKWYQHFHRIFLTPKLNPLKGVNKRREGVTDEISDWLTFVKSVSATLVSTARFFLSNRNALFFPPVCNVPSWMKLTLYGQLRPKGISIYHCSYTYLACITLDWKLKSCS